MKHVVMRKLCLLFLILSLLLPTLTACGNGGTLDTSDATKLSFKEALSYDTLSSMAGKKVTINGYMATSSPVDGSFFFLMNLPYQSCPFCKPNTSELSNTIEIYTKKQEKLTDIPSQAIKVVGTLAVAPEGQPFTDKYGYEFSFKIVDAAYAVLSEEELTGDTLLWQKIADSGLVDTMYQMLNYVNFTCSWTGYYGVGTDGKPFYLYPSDAEKFIKNEGAQYNYGYKTETNGTTYFDRAVNTANKLSETKLASLVEIIRDLEDLANEALLELDSKAYTYEEKTFTIEGKGTNTDYVYTLNRAAALTSAYEDLYYRFADWLASWEL